MPKSSTQTPPPPDGLIVEQDLPTEMRTSFLEYAYSVIYARALPDARDLSFNYILYFHIEPAQRFDKILSLDRSFAPPRIRWKKSE